MKRASDRSTIIFLTGQKSVRRSLSGVPIEGLGDADADDDDNGDDVDGARRLQLKQLAFQDLRCVPGGTRRNTTTKVESSVSQLNQLNLCLQ